MPPRPPHNHQQQHHNPTAVAYTVAEALRNPYGIQPMNQFQNPYSAHYANAYVQVQQAMYTTPEGYTLSSTYNPYAPPQRNIQPPGTSISSLKGKGKPSHNRENDNGPRPAQQHGSWYQPGNSRCTKCSFTGSSKSLEIHMMDRHLIYPPGYDKKNASSWDADLSLKGKTIPIQGTSLILNTPEAVEAWLEERRKRWPTVKRVEEKTTKMEEAIARGQLPLRGNQSSGKKRHNEEGQINERSRKRRNHGDKPTIGESRSSGSVQAASRETRVQGSSASTSTPFIVRTPTIPSPESDDDSDDSAPEVVSSKPPQQSTPVVETPEPPAISTGKVVSPKRNNQNQAHKHRAREPKLPPRNPFASRPTLLRNLLLPEIRMTVSNLSQAIRFLVDNNFLRGVELKPGQADEKLIEVVESLTSTEST